MAKRALLKVVLPDAHFGLSPWDEGARRARECALLSIEALPWVDEVVILGDWLECAAFSSHGKASIRESDQSGYIETEVKPCLEALDRIQAKAKRLVFIAGNHEHRAFRWCTDNVRGGPFSDVYKALEPGELLSKRTNGRKRTRFEYVPYQGELPHYMIAPNLLACHGWSHAQNAAQKHLDAARTVSVIHGHTHRRQEFTRRNPVTGETMFGMSPGCLAPLSPDFHRSPSDHTHGFAVIYQSQERPHDWTHYLVGIQNGRAILPDGVEVLAV